MPDPAQLGAKAVVNPDGTKVFTATTLTAAQQIEASKLAGARAVVNPNGTKVGS